MESTDSCCDFNRQLSFMFEKIVQPDALEKLEKVAAEKVVTMSAREQPIMRITKSFGNNFHPIFQEVKAT